MNALSNFAKANDPTLVMENTMVSEPSIMASPSMVQNDSLASVSFASPIISSPSRTPGSSPASRARASNREGFRDDEHMGVQETVPKKLSQFKEGAILVRVVNKICKDKESKRERVMIMTNFGLAICRFNGETIRFVSWSKARQLIRFDHFLLLRCGDQFDIVIELVAHPKNTSNDAEIVHRLIGRLCRFHTMANFRSNNVKSYRELMQGALMSANAEITEAAGGNVKRQQKLALQRHMMRNDHVYLSMVAIKDSNARIMESKLSNEKAKKRSNEMQAALKAYYRLYDPEKLERVPNIVTTFYGHEESVLNYLRWKYPGPDPVAFPEAAAAHAKAVAEERAERELEEQEERAAAAADAAKEPGPSVERIEEVISGAAPPPPLVLPLEDIAVKAAVLYEAEVLPNTAASEEEKLVPPVTEEQRIPPINAESTTAEITPSSDAIEEARSAEEDVALLTTGAPSSLPVKIGDDDDPLMFPMRPDPPASNRLQEQVQTPQEQRPFVLPQRRQHIESLLPDFDQLDSQVLDSDDDLEDEKLAAVDSMSIEVPAESTPPPRIAPEPLKPQFTPPSSAIVLPQGVVRGEKGPVFAPKSSLPSSATPRQRVAERSQPVVTSKAAPKKGIDALVASAKESKQRQRAALVAESSRQDQLPGTIRSTAIRAVGSATGPSSPIVPRISTSPIDSMHEGRVEPERPLQQPRPTAMSFRSTGSTESEVKPRAADANRQLAKMPAALVAHENYQAKSMSSQMSDRDSVTSPSAAPASILMKFITNESFDVAPATAPRRRSPLNSPSFSVTPSGPETETEPMLPLIKQVTPTAMELLEAGYGASSSGGIADQSIPTDDELDVSDEFIEGLRRVVNKSVGFAFEQQCRGAGIPPGGTLDVGVDDEAPLQVSTGLLHAYRKWYRAAYPYELGIRGQPQSEDEDATCEVPPEFVEYVTFAFRDVGPLASRGAGVVVTLSVVATGRRVFEQRVSLSEWNRTVEQWNVAGL